MRWHHEFVKHCARGKGQSTLRHSIFSTFSSRSLVFIYFGTFLFFSLRSRSLKTPKSLHSHRFGWWNRLLEGNCELCFVLCLLGILSRLSESQIKNDDADCRNIKKEKSHQKDESPRIYPFFHSLWHNRKCWGHDERWDVRARERGEQQNNINFNLQIH